MGSGANTDPYGTADGQQASSEPEPISFILMRVRPLALVALAAAACQRSPAGAACGFTNVAGATLLLNEFGRPNQTLSAPPRAAPPRLVLRLVAGPAYPSVIGRSADSLVVGMEGTLPPRVEPGFGVLVLDPTGKPRGILLYESPVIKGAPRLGNVTVGDKVVPLIGIQVDPARIEDPRCPFFPDSVLK